MKIIQITDTHLTSQGELIHGLDPFDELTRCITRINSEHSDADLCVFTGDLTSGGPVEGYRALRECLTHLKVPYVLLIGNHDMRSNFLKVFSDLPHDDNGFIQSVKRTPTGHLIFLDTVEDGSNAGYYCQLRQDWLNLQLDEAAGWPVYLFMHHPPGDTGVLGLDEIRLQDGESFENSLARHKDVRFLFCGHVHKTISGNWRGYPYAALRGTNHSTSSNWAGEPIDVRHESPQYAIILINQSSTLVHVHDYLTFEEMKTRDDTFKLEY